MDYLKPRVARSVSDFKNTREAIQKERIAEKYILCALYVACIVCFLFIYENVQL